MVGCSSEIDFSHPSQHPILKGVVDLVRAADLSARGLVCFSGMKRAAALGTPAGARTAIYPVFAELPLHPATVQVK
jgi:hypothetical protein